MTIMRLTITSSLGRLVPTLLLLLVSLGVIISRSIEIFTERSSIYRERVETILESAFNLIESTQQTLSQTRDGLAQAAAEINPFVEAAQTPADEAAVRIAKAKQSIELAREKAIEFMNQARRASRIARGSRLAEIADLHHRPAPLARGALIAAAIGSLLCDRRSPSPISSSLWTDRCVGKVVYICKSLM